MSTASGKKGWIVKGLLSLGLLAVLAFALDSLVFSDASFTAGSAHSTAFTAGTLGHLNTRNGELLIDATGLVPGDSVSGAVVITGLGDVPGDYTLSVSGLADTPGSPRLSDALELTIAEVTAGATLYAGRVSGFSRTDLGSIAPGESRTYSVTLTYPDGTNDSGLQGASMALNLRVVGVTA